MRTLKPGPRGTATPPKQPRVKHSPRRLPLLLVTWGGENIAVRPGPAGPQCTAQTKAWPEGQGWWPDRDRDPWPASPCMPTNLSGQRGTWAGWGSRAGRLRAGATPGPGGGEEAAKGRTGTHLAEWPPAVSHAWPAAWRGCFVHSGTPGASGKPREEPRVVIPAPGPSSALPLPLPLRPQGRTVT